MNHKIEERGYLRLEKHANGNLAMRILPEFLAQAREDAEGSPVQVLDWLLEPLLINGWQWIRPEQIGALTSAPLISDEVWFGDDGELEFENGARVYGFMDYQISDPAACLLNGKEIIWVGDTLERRLANAATQ